MTYAQAANYLTQTMNVLTLRQRYANITTNDALAAWSAALDFIRSATSQNGIPT
jgi:hypothetical protein